MSFSNDYGSFREAAQNAYTLSDGEKSRMIHEQKLEEAKKRRAQKYGDDAKKSSSNRGRNDSARDVLELQTAEEGHRSDGGVLKSIIYGGLDGILTAFALISGAAGGKMTPEVILVMGLSNIVADAIAMGVGDCISSLSYHEYVKREARREEWEFDNFPEGEIEEMIDLYEEKGLPREHAEEVVKRMAKYRDFFISVMLVEELKLQIPGEDESPYKDGFITFTSFFVLGMLPILAFAIFPYFDPTLRSDTLTKIASVITLVVLFILGMFKSKFSLMSWWRSGLEFVLLGGTVALTSYLIGEGVARLVVEVTGDESYKIPGEPL